MLPPSEAAAEVGVMRFEAAVEVGVLKFGFSTTVLTLLVLIAHLGGLLSMVGSWPGQPSRGMGCRSITTCPALPPSEQGVVTNAMFTFEQWKQVSGDTVEVCEGRPLDSHVVSLTVKKKPVYFKCSI